ncbi:MAG: hypothetical protein KBT35_01820 [Firmicutes bacterium]|nr:hypothetical protein [Candidatus Colivicinus equi]
MDNTEVKNQVEEVVEDLKAKVNDLDEACKDVDNQTVKDIQNKTIATLNLAIERITTAANEMINSEEVQKGVEFVKAKSKDLYDNALKKIEEIKGNEELNKAFEKAEDYVANAAKTVGETVEKTEVYQNAKQQVDNFMNKKEVKDAINNAKKETVNIAEKALDTLKDWLDPKE